MKILCNDISISDSEFGCEICFSDKIDRGYHLKDNVVDSLGNYVLLQRAYPEDDFDEDYSHIEFSDFGKSGKLKDCKLDLYRTYLLIDYQREKIEIIFSADDSKFRDIKDVLHNIVCQCCKLIIHD